MIIHEFRYREDVQSFKHTEQHVLLVFLCGNNWIILIIKMCSYIFLMNINYMSHEHDLIL